MRQAGLNSIPVVDDERCLVGMCEAEEVARLAERNERELRAAVDTTTPRVEKGTGLREILPLFVERDVPVAVVGENDHLEGVVVRGSLIAGLTTSAEQPDGGEVTFNGGGSRPEGVLPRGEVAGQEAGGER
jgi:glycine betaine/proline transport system ATP-binding protein